MARPTVLLIDTQETRRKELVRGLASAESEVIVAASVHEGQQFAEALNPEIVIAEGGLAGISDADAIATGGRSGPFASSHKLFVLWQTDTPPERRAPNVTVLELRNLSPGMLLQRLQAALLGISLGLATDSNLKALVGSFDTTPLFDLLPVLKKGVCSGQLFVSGGVIELREGEVVGASSGKTTGLKAFCRLARLASGAFRLALGPSAARQIKQDALTLMATAIEEQHRYLEWQAELPDLASRLKVVLGPSFFSVSFSPVQQKVLEDAQRGATIFATLNDINELDGEVLAAIAGLRRLGFLELLPPRLRARIVTDSAADLTPELAEKHQITVVPITVLFGDRAFKDGTDLSPAAFYDRIRTGRADHPRAEAPSADELLKAFRPLVGEDEIVAVHTSQEMSGTLVHARVAAKELEREVIELSGADHWRGMHVVDSRQISAGLALVVVCAARMAVRGLLAAEIAVRVETMRERVRQVFALDTLEHLARSGHVGRAGAFFGSLLSVKPIFEMRGGRLVALDRAHGGRELEARVVQMLRERIDPARPVMVAIAHGGAPERGGRIRAEVERSFKVAEVLLTEIGPGVGADFGPGTVGCAVFQPTDEELSLIGPTS
jgi:DegV family protein with EDD domain